MNNHPRSEFDKRRFNHYIYVWRSLQSLRIAGEDLWSNVTDENILKFSQELRSTTKITLSANIFFEEDEILDLSNLLEKFACFRLGKINLFEIRSKDIIDHLVFFRHSKYSNGDEEEEIRLQIQENRVYKEQYEQLLDKIRRTFRSRLTQT